MAFTTAPSNTALRIRAGRVLAMRHAPYLSTALLRMTIVESEHCPTAATDARWRFYINPRFAEAHSADELAYIWLHEVSHCLRGHPQRWVALGEPDVRHPVFNLAGDALINADVDEMVQVRLTDAVRLATLGLTRDKRSLPVEELYRRLLDSAEAVPTEQRAMGDPPTSHHDCGSGSGGPRRDWEVPHASSEDGSVDPGDAELVRDTVAHEVRRHQKTVGNVPGGLARWADARLTPVVDWHTQLRAIVTKTIGTTAGRRDYSYQRPSRRSAPGVVLPGMVAHAPPSVAVVIDTSGSMAPSDLARALAETGEIVQRLGRSKRGVRVLACDSAPHEAQVVRDVRNVRLEGGGGTDMESGIRYALDLKPRPDLVVVITDGYTPWPIQPPVPPTPIVAVITEAQTSGYVPGWIHTIDTSPAVCAQ